MCVWMFLVRLCWISNFSGYSLSFSPCPLSIVSRSIAHGALHIATREGVPGFFRGLVPTLLLIAPQTGLQFSIYHTVNQLFTMVRHRSSLSRGNVPVELEVGACESNAGNCCFLPSHRLCDDNDDVSKTLLFDCSRWQNDRSYGYSSIWREWIYTSIVYQACWISPRALRED